MKLTVNETLSTKQCIAANTAQLFGLASPQRIRQNLTIELTEHSYLPKAGDPRSDWVATVAYPAFMAIKQMGIGSSTVGRFGTIGTGTGLDALAAIEVFGCSDVVITDLHQDVVKAAAQNVIKNLQDNAAQVKILALTGDLLEPLHQTQGESPRVWWRLQHLREWSHEEETESIYTGRS